MNIPEIKSYEEQAIDTVVSVINRAKEKLGVRQTLRQLAITSHDVYMFKLTLILRNFLQIDGGTEAINSMGSVDIAQAISYNRDFACNAKLSLKAIGPPFAITSEKFINYTIEKKWKLGETFMYVVRYMGGSKDEVSQYYYFEAIFSQPTVSYPIPQAQVSVFFRLEDKHIEPPDERGVPLMYFRVEGHSTEHDMRFVALSADWILAMIKMKIKLFQRIESIRMF